eukprot:gene56070-46397_t
MSFLYPASQPCWAYCTYTADITDTDARVSAWTGVVAIYGFAPECRPENLMHILR